MAYTATVTILIDEEEEASVTNSIHKMLRCSWVENGGNVVDWTISHLGAVCDEMKDSIANDTYAEGDAFRDWVIFSRSEMEKGNGAGFWSNEYGWTTLDLATKFAGTEGDKPATAADDATWMLPPFSMNFYRVILIERPGDAMLDQTPIAYECWAETEDHAKEQVIDAYPGCRVLEIEDMELGVDVDPPLKRLAWTKELLVIKELLVSCEAAIAAQQRIIEHDGPLEAHGRSLKSLLAEREELLPEILEIEAIIGQF